MREYQIGLKNTFEALADGKVIARKFSARFPSLLFTSYRYHKVFYFKQSDVAVIIGVIHEQRDIVKCLKRRM